MATNTIGTYLYHKATGGTGFTKLMDISSFPDIFAPPEKLESTTLSDKMKTYVPGLQDTSDLVFECNHMLSDMTKIQGLQGKITSWQLRFGINGEDGAFQWDGDIFYSPKGGGVGEVRKADITIYPSTEIKVVTVTP